MRRHRQRRGAVRRILAQGATLAALGGLGRPGLAATLVIENADGPGVGFNDLTPAAPVGGNRAATRGAQALAALQYAARLWEAALDSPVPIRVSAHFAPLACTASSGTLGMATPRAFSRNERGLTPGVWYPIALANRLAGVDLAPREADIDASFNGAAGTAGCLATTAWYLGFDGASGAGADLVSVVLHELAHGLGMTTLVDLGAGLLNQGTPDVFSLHLLDESTGLHWPEMDDAARARSARNTQHLVWDGAEVTAAASTTLARGVPTLTLSAPLDRLSPAIGIATFGPALTTAKVAGVMAMVDDAVGSPGDACEPPAPLTGKVAFVEAGGCTDVAKALSVQGAGAVAAILVDSLLTAPPLAPTGTGGGAVTIPVVRVTQSDAGAMRAALGAAVSATLQYDAARLRGASATGRVYLYAPDPVQVGHSVTHWDPIAQPDLLMEPSLATKPSLDLTLPLMHDLGWRPYRCGDGIPEGAEQCDEGPDGGTSGRCRPDCTLTLGLDGGIAGAADAAGGGCSGAGGCSPRDGSVGGSGGTTPGGSGGQPGIGVPALGPDGGSKVTPMLRPPGCACALGPAKGPDGSRLPALGALGALIALAIGRRARPGRRLPGDRSPRLW
jgi:hypothetical protein